MNGYNGKILRVNLTAGDFSIDEPSEAYYKHYIGGRGFIVHTLLTEVPKSIDPLGPENKLIFSLGPITGHLIPGSGRNAVGAKSPLTGGYGESEAGGFWGAELKRAGYDAIIIEGIAPKPTYLWIDNGKVEIRDARKLWRLEVADAVMAIKEELGDKAIRTATIGPGGEKLVRYACIANDISHMAGRTGMGAVMGSKRLKAIAVRGKAAPEVADRGKAKELMKRMAKSVQEKAPMYWKFGTGAIMTKYEAEGNLPINNFQGGTFHKVENITAQRMHEKGYVERMDTCFMCPVRCKKRVNIESPYKVNPIYGGPEYETLAALGSNCGIDNLEAIIQANELCARYGIDSISAGMSISFAMECFEKGILTREDTDGLELTFGNVQVMVEMVERIGLRRGFGDLLAEGTRRAAEVIGKGSSEFALHVKGMELPMHEPRYKQGMALHFSVHATGPDHNSGIHDERVDQAGWEGIDIAEAIPHTELSPQKARLVYQMGLWRHMVNYLGLCLFIPLSFTQIVEAMEAITGWPMSYWKLMKAVERGITLARIFNIREGFSIEDDALPKRFTTPMPDGPLKGVFIDPDDLLKAQKIYYQMLGWNEAGIPTPGRLAELDIEWASDYFS